MKTKRLTSILLALLMVVGLCVPAYAVETPALELSVDKTEVTVGDTITVTISCDTEITGIQGWGMDLYLDSRAYKLVDSAIYGGYNEMFGEVTDNIETHSSVNISAFSMNSKYLLTIPNGTLATLTFEVIDASTETFQLEDVGAMRPDEATNNLLAETSNAVSVIAKNPNDAVIYQYQGSGNPCSHAYLETVVLKDMKDSVLMVAEEGNWPVVLLDGTKVKSGDTITMYITKAGEKVDELTVRNNTYVFGANEITVTDNLYITDLLLEHYFDPCYRSNSFGPRFCLINLTIDQAELALKVGETGTLVANTNSARNNRISQYITWSSDNEAVATVSGGTVTAVSAGTATITASIGTMSVSCEVTVAHNFDGVILEIAKQTPIDRYGTVYFSLPAGQDLMIVLDTKGALQQFDDIRTNTRLEHTFTQDCVITVTAEELAKYFLDDEWRGYLPDYGITPDENNEYLDLMAFNGSRTYEIILEVISAEEPEQPTADGYTFATSADISAENGDNVVVKVNITGHSDENVTTYNAYDVTLTYDNEKLEYVSYDGAVQSDNGQVEVDKENGTIRIVGCGADKDFGTEIAALTFKTKGEGEANVTISKVQVSDKDTAVDDNIPEASAKHDEDDTNADATPDVSVVVVPYTVTKPTFVSGNDKVLHGESYTFSYTDTTNYTYSGLTVTVGGTAVTPTEAGGVYTIESVTGTVVITATQIANSYDVTKPENVTGPDKATYDIDYEFTVTPGTDMAIDTVTVATSSGAAVPYTINENGKYVIAGTNISGPFTITVTQKDKMTTITFTGVKETEVEGGLTQSAEIGKDFNFKLNKEAAYNYTVKVAETELSESTVTPGQYTIPASLVVQGGVTVNITKADSSKVVVDVHEYINLDGKAMFLVTAKWRDKVLSYGEGNTMFWSSKYTVTGYDDPGAYCWLVVSTDEMNTMDQVKAAAEAAIVEAAAGTTANAVSYDYDVNRTTKVDVNDAQLVYDMYKVSYMEFTDTLPMIKFLEADVSTNMKLDVNDVAAIINQIVTGNQA